MGKKHKKKRQLQLSQKTKLLIAVTGGVTIVAVVIVVLLVIINRQNTDTANLNLTDDQKAQQERNVKQAQRDNAIRQSANDALQKGDVEKADQVYADAIASEAETARKVQLYIDQSRLLYSVGETEKAIKVAKDAEKQTDDKFLIADWLARVYEDQKQYSLALQYYETAAKTVSSPNNIYKFDKKHYDLAIARVSALEKK